MTCQGSGEVAYGARKVGSDSLESFCILSVPMYSLDIPDTYKYDDTPKRFREIMNPTKAKKTAEKSKGKDKSGATRKDRPNDVWTVRPGEGFREYNSRILDAGYTVPPGVPETFRGPFTPRPADVKPAKKYAQEPAVPGEKTRKKRTDYLKQKKEQSKRQKVENTIQSEDSDYEVYEQKKLRDVAKAPPVFRSLPRENLKMKVHEKPQHSHKKPSLLPILKRANRKK